MSDETWSDTPLLCCLPCCTVFLTSESGHEHSRDRYRAVLCRGAETTEQNCGAVSFALQGDSDFWVSV